MKGDSWGLGNLRLGVFWGVDMKQTDEENPRRQVVVAAGILLSLAVLVSAVLLGWRLIPGVTGEWIGFMVGVVTTPFFLEASFVILGLLLVLMINHWRTTHSGDELVYLEVEETDDVGVATSSAASPKKTRVKAPDKELRFTRSGQAVLFWLMASVFTAVAFTIAATAIYRDVNPELPHPLWALVPIAMAAGAARMAVKLTRHAYLILTPIGIEIFPFFRPATGMHMVMWQEIDTAEVNAQQTLLTLHHNADKTSGIHLSLRPVRSDLRQLLGKAVMARVSGGIVNGE